MRLPHASTAPVGLFAATVFVSAFLLFQLQPMIGKYILPWFGSTPGVWATALLFFQLVLLGGYAYAHFVVARLSWRGQAILHATLLGLALLALPITPDDALEPTRLRAPAGQVLLVLTLSVGVPFFLLSTTAPLLQRWLAQLRPGRSPYRLYALSNLGSLLALLSYPFLVERFLRLQTQTWIWSLAYLAFAGLCGACAWYLAQSPVSLTGPQDEDGAEDRPGTGRAVLWLLFSACGSGLLLATTNQMSLDIAVVPFLWILPLSLYLVTFILSFDSEHWYVRPLFSALLALSLINAVRLLYAGIDVGIVDQVVGYSITLFVCCMCCHGELARLRPAPRHLTLFFLMVSVGGALGGIFVALLSPAVFPGFYEYPILLVACAGLVVFAQLSELFRGTYTTATSPVGRVLSGICWEVVLAAITVGTLLIFIPSTWFDADPSSNMAASYASWRAGMLESVPYAGVGFLVALEVWRRRLGQPWRDWWGSGHGVAKLSLSAFLVLGLWSLSGALFWQVQESERTMIAQERNFYGMLAITESGAGETGHRLSLTHGRILHGHQSVARPGWPSLYYGPESGAGLALRFHPARSDTTRRFRVGVVGLGVGMLAAYANARIDSDLPDEYQAARRQGPFPDYMGFYEINPLVMRWAKERFTFLEDARTRGAEVEVFEGDARIVLERQLETGGGQRFDVLAVDAFSSDAIPLHLLTRESLRLYMGHLKEDGIVAIHVTNRYVDLIPIVGRLAEDAGVSAIHIADDGRARPGESSNDWVLMTSNRLFLELAAVREHEQAMPEPGALWTDDFSSLFGAIELHD